MPDYNVQDFSPSYGGTIDSSGNVKNIADALTGTGSNTKLKVDASPQVIFLKESASNTWTIDHHLNRFPQVTVVDTTGAQMVGDVNWTSTNQVVITFSSAVAGRAILT
jgi:hypothetical protein